MRTCQNESSLSHSLVALSQRLNNHFRSFSVLLVFSPWKLDRFSISLVWKIIHLNVAISSTDISSEFEYYFAKQELKLRNVIRKFIGFILELLQKIENACNRGISIFSDNLFYIVLNTKKKSRVVETVRSSMNNNFHKLMATGKVHCSPGRSVRSFENRTILSLELEMERMRSFCISNQVLIASVLYLTVRMYVRIIL